MTRKLLPNARPANQDTGSTLENVSDAVKELAAQSATRAHACGAGPATGSTLGNVSSAAKTFHIAHHVRILQLVKSATSKLHE